jgi:hypothetical protein
MPPARVLITLQEEPLVLLRRYGAVLFAGRNMDQIAWLDSSLNDLPVILNSLIPLSFLNIEHFFASGMIVAIMSFPGL